LDPGPFSWSTTWATLLALFLCSCFWDRVWLILSGLVLNLLSSCLCWDHRHAPLHSGLAKLSLEERPRLLGLRDCPASASRVAACLPPIMGLLLFHSCIQLLNSLNWYLNLGACYCMCVISQ
jgi:hypothetical protein